MQWAVCTRAEDEAEGVREGESLGAVVAADLGGTECLVLRAAGSWHAISGVFLAR